MLYIPSMILRSRLGSLSLVLVLLATVAACGGRTVTRRSAEKLLVSLPSGILDEKDVEVLGVTQISSNNAIADTRVRAAFALEKVDGKWVVRQVRVGNDQWESIDNLRAALNRIKTEQTRQLLETIASSIARYEEKNGRLPVFNNYQELSDALYPDYQSEPLRLDAWRQPIRAFREGKDTIRLVSSGPDEKPDTPDDIILVKSYGS
jgi:hypothetical protein